MANLGCEWLNLPGIMREYQLTCVVELGCGYGGSLGAVMALQAYNLNPVYFGCDVDEAAIKHCKANVPSAVLAHRTSMEFLESLLDTSRVPLEMPTLWWLDAHSFSPEEPDELAFPLVHELRFIRENKPFFERDVILCDDLRVIADEANPRYIQGELPAQYVRDEHTYNEYTEPFRKTHQVRVFLQDEGVLGFYPYLNAMQRTGDSSGTSI